MSRLRDSFRGHRVGSLPSAWLGFYSCTLLLGGVYLTQLVWNERTMFPVATAVLAATAVAAGVLLWFQARAGLYLYMAVALGVIIFAAYRFAWEGYTFGRAGMAIGGLMMLYGYRSVADELRVVGQTTEDD